MALDTVKEWQKRQWCWDNEITIYPIIWKEAKPEYPPRLAIQVNYKGFKRTGEFRFSQKRPGGKEALYFKINELYSYYYDRAHN